MNNVANSGNSLPGSRGWTGKPWSVSAFLLLIILSGCTDRNSLRIHNYTKSDITVVSARLDGKIISNRELIVPPTPKDRYSFIAIYTSFRAANPRVLEIEINYPAGATSASCDLGNIIKHGGCLIGAVYIGTNQLKCSCNPYADFKD